MNPETQAVDLDFFQHAEQFETMLQDLHQAAAADNLSEIVGKLPEKFSLVGLYTNNSFFILNTTKVLYYQLCFKFYNSTV